MEPHVHVDIIEGVLSFCPVLNINMGATAIWFASLQNIGILTFLHGILFRLISSAVLITIYLLISLYVSFSIKKQSYVIMWFFALMTATGITRVIDSVLWGGAIDYIRLGNRVIFDIADMYINVGALLMAVMVIYYLQSYLKLSKEERKRIMNVKRVTRGCP